MLVSLMHRVSPKLSLPLGSAWFLWSICQYHSQLESKIRFDLQTKVEPELQFCILRCDCKLSCPRQGQIEHCFGSTLWYEFFLVLEAPYILGIKIDFLFLSVTEEHRRMIQFRLISNLLRSTVWVISGLLIISQIVTRILAMGFLVALHWHAFLRE